MNMMTNASGNGVANLLSGQTVLYVVDDLDTRPHYRIWADMMGGVAIGLAGQAELLKWLRFHQTTKFVVVIDNPLLDRPSTLDLAAEARQVRPDVPVIAMARDGSENLSIPPRYSDLFVHRSPGSLHEFAAAVQSAGLRRRAPLGDMLLTRNAYAGPEFDMVDAQDESGMWPAGWWLGPMLLLGAAMWALLAMAIFG
jgi:hypothetical protein